MSCPFDIFDILDYGAIIYSDRINGVLVTFNGGRTFNIWVTDGGTFYNTDVWTYGGYDEPSNWSIEELKAYCQKHFDDEWKLDQERKDSDEYECGDRVKILETGETGVIIEVDRDEPMYYVDIEGRQMGDSAVYFYSDEVELIEE